VAEKPKENVTELAVREVVDAIRQDKSGQININILIQQVSEKSHNADEILSQTERAMALAKKFDEDRLESFVNKANAVIEAKLRDPDEIQKRQNNRVRRCLKLSIGGMAVLGVLGGLATVALGGGLVVATLLLLIGAVSVAMMGPLASGESLSASDVVQILQGMGTLVPGNSGSKKEGKR
jgi:hypothetical protein